MMVVGMFLMVKRDSAQKRKLATMSPQQQKVYIAQVAHESEFHHDKYSAGTRLGVRCPTCGSDQVAHISRSRKAARVGMLGVFAIGGIDKTFRCGRCDYRW
jgi:hypothetical protein